MTQTKKNNKKIVIGAIVLAVLVALMAVVYFVFGAKTVAGTKQLTIEVINQEQETTTYAVETEAEYLRQAMEEAEGLSFVEEGGMVITINGERADYTLDGAYWSFLINGEYCNFGVNEQPVADGDAFEIIYTPAQ